MRSQHHSFVNIPIPRHIPPKLVLDYVQTYEPILRHNPGMVSWSESTLNHETVLHDTFFDASNQSLRCYEAYEIIKLGPGVERDVRWPIVFQKVPNGIVSRTDAPAKVITWTQWYVRMRQQNEQDVSTPSTATPSSSADDEWELYGIVTLEAHRMLIPWCTRKTKLYQEAIGQGIVDDICSKYNSELSMES
ncbi:hypothetical protein LB507_005444, partial [Fusarium sp. FIESC RH6]